MLFLEPAPLLRLAAPQLLHILVEGRHKRFQLLRHTLMLLLASVQGALSEGQARFGAIYCLGSLCTCRSKNAQ
jgi:hypothetical protein